jgi:hypothetical protein
MMKHLYLFLVAVLFLAFSGSLVGQSRVASAGATFLGIGVGTRAMGMGGAFTSMTDDPTLIYWNPAAIARNKGTQVSFTNANWLIGTQIKWAGGTVNFGNIGTFGVGVTLLTTGDIEQTTEARPEGTGRFFSASNLAFKTSYAYAFTERFSVGTNVKYIQEVYDDVSGGTIAVDLGILFLVRDNLRIAATMSNFGGTIQLTGNSLLTAVSSGTGLNGENPGIPAQLQTTAWELPVFYRIGISSDVVKTNLNRLTLSVDWLNPSDNDQSFNVGAEYGWRDVLFFRSGYNSLFLPFSETGLTLGAGVKVEVARYALRVDYAYQSFNRLNAPQWISIALTF